MFGFLILWWFAVCDVVLLHSGTWGFWRFLMLLEYYFGIGLGGWVGNVIA